MRKILLSAVVGLLAVGMFSSVASAHGQFMKAMKAKYEFRTVSCYTCHAKGENPKTGERYGKEVRNDFGKLFMPHLKGKDIDARVAKAKETEDEAEKEKLDEAITNDFLEALEKVEVMKADDGKTYAEKLKAGEIEGVKLPE